MAAILDLRSAWFWLFLIYKSPKCFLPSFESTGLSVQEKQKNRFSRWLPWRPSWFYDLHDFSYFWSTSHPNASHQVWSQLAFGFRSKSEKQIFKMAAMAAILDFRSTRFQLFLIYKSSWCFLACLESIGLSVQEEKQKIDFQDGCHGGHLGFPIGTILATFDLQVTLMLPSKFGVN